jgi:AcrR family transcriptional regulator
VTKRAQGTPAGLSRARIVGAAVALADRDGLESFGVRRLASELGVDPMSIYNHIKGKAALLDAISETVLAEASTDAAQWSDDWMQVARTLAHGYRDMAIRHPRIFPLLTTRAQISDVALEALERLTTAMRSAGIADQAIADIPMVLFGFLNGYLLAILSSNPGQAGDPVGGAAMSAFDLDRYPTLAALAPLQAGYGSEAEFERMLETLLAGIASGTAGKHTPPSAKARPGAATATTRGSTSDARLKRRRTEASAVEHA